MHERYQALLDKADWSVRNNRDVFHILDEDVIRARLYAYGYRTQTIGAFHACKVSLIEALGSSGSESRTFQMLMGILDELQSLATIPVPEDFRALIYTLHTYDRGVQNACDSFEKLLDETKSDAVLRIKRSFQKAMARVSSGNGIYVAQDNVLPEQGSFVVPNLEITIVPLIYGEHHSWNSTHLPGPCIDATNHRHHAGVEIHLGYSPVHGITMLDGFRSQIREGYAMPIPVMIDHGLDNLSDQEHWVPFIFGSLTLGGWGVFFDVEPCPAKAQDLRKVPLESPEMGNSVFIERVIERVAQTRSQSSGDRNPRGGHRLREIRSLAIGYLQSHSRGARSDLRQIHDHLGCQWRRDHRDRPYFPVAEGPRPRRHSRQGPCQNRALRSRPSGDPRRRDHGGSKLNPASEHPTLTVIPH